MAVPLLGARALIDRAIPTGLDGAEILKFQLRDGRTAEQVIGEAAAMIGDLNEQLNGEFGGLWTITEQQFARYADGQSAASKTPVKTEFKRADGVRSRSIGHMLPLENYEDAVEWTPLYLRDAYAIDVTNDLQLIADRWRNRVWDDFVQRALTNTERAIGSAGYDVPWAIGTGVNVPYIPPQYRNYTFDGDHSHFVVANTGNSGTFKTMIENMMGHLRHHGHSGVLSALVSYDDLASYSAFSTTGEFVEFNPAAIQVIAGSSNAPVRTTPGIAEGVPGEVFGWWKSKHYGLCELRADPGIPTGYAWMAKSYGMNSPRNPVAVRVHPSEGFGLMLDPQVTRSINPELDFIQFRATHGVGVNDRIAAVAGFCGASATWVNPSF